MIQRPEKNGCAVAFIWVTLFWIALVALIMAVRGGLL